MGRVRMLVGATFLTLGIASALPGMWATPARAGDIDAQIAAAKTPADHEAIAAWYDTQAKEAQDKAAEHQKMGDAYKQGGGALAHKTNFHQHCEALVKSYTAEAKEYRALAAEHRAMAKAAK